MKRSSRKQPCPFCGRTHDSDCAWTEDVAFCHSGSDLSIGQTIDIDGQPWALVKLNAGFSGNAAVFKPHTERNGFSGNPVNRQQILSRQASRSVSAALIEQFFAAFDRAWNVLDFHSLSPNELKDGFQAIQSAYALGIQLNGSIKSIWRDHHDLRDLYKDRFDACLANLKYQFNDLNHFKSHYLGETI